MNFKDLLKKYWFVCIVAIALLAFVGVYAKDTYENRELTVSNKQVDGQYAVYSVNDDYVFADDFFDSLYSRNGVSTAFVQFQRAVLDKAYETTQEMKDNASNYGSYVYQYYGADYISNILKQMGYTNGSDDIIQYYIDSQKQDLLMKEYISAHYDEVVPNYIEQKNVKLVYQILIKVANVNSIIDDDGNTIYAANPTDEEKAKLDEVLKALETQDFLTVQEQYNEDSSNDAFFISTDTSSNYVTIFSNTSLALNENEVSEPVVSNYGYHIIKSIGANKDDLINNSDFISGLESFDTTLNIKGIMEKANELGFELVNEELKNMVETTLQSEVTE